MQYFTPCSICRRWKICRSYRWVHTSQMLKVVTVCISFNFRIKQIYVNTAEISQVFNRDATMIILQPSTHGIWWLQATDIYTHIYIYLSGVISFVTKITICWGFFFLMFTQDNVRYLTPAIEFEVSPNLDTRCIPYMHLPTWKHLWFTNCSLVTSKQWVATCLVLRNGER